MATAKKKPVKKTAKKATKVVKKTARKAPAKKATKKTATKRAYTRKPKVETHANGDEFRTYTDADVQAQLGETAQEAVNEATAKGPSEFDWAEYDQYDLRPMPRLGRALFLLELESRGYILRDSLKPVSEDSYGLRTERLEAIEIVRLNHENKIISFALFSDLTAADGLVGLPTTYRGGFELIEVGHGLAAPSEITILGETFVRQRK